MECNNFNCAHNLHGAVCEMTSDFYESCDECFIDNDVPDSGEEEEEEEED